MTRPPATARGYNARWQRTRRAFLRQHPHCNRCTAPATVVHHIDGQGPLASHGHDPTNLEALCKPCHDRHTAQHQPGGWHARPPRRRPTSPHPGLTG